MSLSRTVSRIKELLFRNRGTRQTIVKNFFWLSVGQIIGRLIRASIIIYAARILGAADYGVFSYVLGLAGFFTIFADIGVSSILTREASKRPEQRSQIFATTFWIKAALLIGTGVVIMFVAPSFSKIDAARALIPFVAFLTIFDGVRDFSIAFLRALEKMELEAFVNILTNVAITVAGFAILMFSPTAHALTVSYVLSSGAGALAVILILRKEYAKLVSQFDKNLIRPVLSAAIPIAIIGLLGSFMLNMDMIMLGWWRTAAELGYYSAAQKILQVIYILPSLLVSAIFPALSRFAAEMAEEKVRKLLEQAMTVLYAVAFPLAVGGVILATPIMVLLYGGEYVPAAAAFQFLIVTVVLVFPSALLGNLSLAYNQQLRLAVPVATASIANIVFNALLIPPFGIAGCSVDTIIAMLASNIITWRIVKRRVIDFKTIRYLPRIVLATIAMGIFVFLLNFLQVPVILNMLISGLLYVATLFLIREPLTRELHTLVMALRGKAVSLEQPSP